MVISMQPIFIGFHLTLRFSTNITKIKCQWVLTKEIKEAFEVRKVQRIEMALWWDLTNDILNWDRQRIKTNEIPNQD